jgi:hypothetical protein
LPALPVSIPLLHYRHCAKPHPTRIGSPLRCTQHRCADDPMTHFQFMHIA